MQQAGTGVVASKLVVEALATRRKVRSPPSVDGGAAMMRRWHAGTSTQLGDTQTVAVSCRGAGCMARIVELLMRVREIVTHSVEPAAQ